MALREMRSPRATDLAMPMAATVWPLRSTSDMLASAPPRMSSTARAARAGLRSRGRAGSRSPPWRPPVGRGALHPEAGLGEAVWLPDVPRSVVVLIRPESSRDSDAQAPRGKRPAHAAGRGHLE